MEDNLLVQINY